MPLVDFALLSSANEMGGLHFCGTILTLTRTGRYPATSPMVPGLSSFLSKRGSLRYSEEIIAISTTYKLGNRAAGLDEMNSLHPPIPDGGNALVQPKIVSLEIADRDS